MHTHTHTHKHTYTHTHTHAHTTEVHGSGKNSLVGAAVKAKVRELEEEVRAGFTRCLRKYLTEVEESVSVYKMFFVRFQDVFKKNVRSNKINTVTVEMIPETE